MTAIVWSKNSCAWCERAKALLAQKEFDIEERNINSDLWTIEDLLNVLPRAKTLPQIFIKDRYIGGYEDLVRALV